MKCANCRAGQFREDLETKWIFQISFELQKYLIVLQRISLNSTHLMIVFFFNKLSEARLGICIGDENGQEE